MTVSSDWMPQGHTTTRHQCHFEFKATVPMNSSSQMENISQIAQKKPTALHHSATTAATTCPLESSSGLFQPVRNAVTSIKHQTNTRRRSPSNDRQPPSMNRTQCCHVHRWAGLRRMKKKRKRKKSLPSKGPCPSLMHTGTELNQGSSKLGLGLAGLCKNTSQKGDLRKQS
jgi:hypothetical protein